MALLKIGAGSIRAYPHSESTGLVIYDTAKIQPFSHSASLSAKKCFLSLTILFFRIFAPVIKASTCEGSGLLCSSQIEDLT